MASNKIENIALYLSNPGGSSKTSGLKREVIKENIRKKIKYGLYGYGPIFDKPLLIDALKENLIAEFPTDYATC